MGGKSEDEKKLEMSSKNVQLEAQEKVVALMHGYDKIMVMMPLLSLLSQ